MEISCFTKEKQLIRKPIEKFNEWSIVEIAAILKPNKELINKLRRKSYQYRIINFNNIPCCLIHKSLYFYPEPKTSTSQGSEAVYLARSANKMDGLLLQYLPPHATTSKHYHKIRSEIYHNLEGCCFLEVDDKDICLDKISYKVSSNKIHQVKTKNEPSLTLLEIIGDPKGLSMDDHYYVRRY